MIYPIHRVLRLSRKQYMLQKKLNHFRATQVLNASKQHTEKHDTGNNFNDLLLKHREKIIFNTYLEQEKLELGYFKYHLKTLKEAKLEQKNQFTRKSLPPLPTALEYCVDKEQLLQEESTEEKDHVNDEVFQLPFAKPTSIETIDQTKIQEKQTQVVSEKAEFDKSDIHKWMANYEYFDDNSLDESEELQDWTRQYGTPDPTISISRVPCGGCGALLHCSEPAIPGYLPSEIFRHRSNEQLKTMECQRCHFLKEYNIALDVSVQTEEYEKLLQAIRYVKSLVILMVDLLDFPCSIWPGIVDIIGTDRPLIIVGNKVDLLPGDSPGYLDRVRRSLITEISKTKLDEAKIRYISLISAKTGYGVENLITAMFREWLGKGDVYLVGSTNVGKSSLFNALLHSDYCKVHAVDIVKRATVSRWPGTTLNLLKFPINRPSGWKLQQRSRRLKNEAKLLRMENEIIKSKNRGQSHFEMPHLIGHIGRSFSNEFIERDGDVPEARRKMMTLDEKNEVFAKSKWFYDTPGVILPDQVLSLLSTEELLLTIPKKTIRPQAYYLYEGNTIFIGGLARIDFVHCSHPCRFTVFCSDNLPLTVCKTEHADEVYSKFLGTELFAVPTGGQERLKNWPGLEKGKEIFEFVGEGPRVCCGDVVLSSVGWVGVTAKGGAKCVVAAWTPQARGLRRRVPAVLPNAINLKGKRLRDTPAYMIGKTFYED